MKRLLLLIDCQYDFINGSLAVDGAEAAMQRLSEYIKANADEYCAIAATLDWHPYNHSSFKVFGGIWPPHCVQHTVGAAIYQPIMDAADGNVHFFTKGDIVDEEQYSIFANTVGGAGLLKLINDLGVESVDVCGIAGDYCVKSSLEGLIERIGKAGVRALLPYTPSIDGGATLGEYLDKADIDYVK